MKDEKLKNIWNMINEPTGIPYSPLGSVEQFLTNRSGSIQGKIRSILQNDLILKVISGIAFLLNILFYWDTPDVLYVCIAGIVFLTIMTTIEWKTLQSFIKILDPGLSTRESLSNIMVFLRRKSNLFELSVASSQVLIFVPGLLLYFYMVYGQVKDMTGFSFMVYSIICITWTIMSFIRTKAQLKFHIKHLTVYLSDLNESSLEFAYTTIEYQRKQDHLVKTLVAFILIFGFAVLMGVLKSVMA